jgi:hypothetical protein
MFCKSSINPITKPNPLYSQSRDNIKVNENPFTGSRVVPWGQEDRNGHGGPNNIFIKFRCELKKMIHGERGHKCALD